MTKRIAIGSDHAGYEYKEAIISMLRSVDGFVVEDMGPSGTDSVDYPDYAHQVAQAVDSGEADIGILLCGSANGVSMTANKYPGVRCAIAWSEPIALLARQHNDANIVAIPARFTSVYQAKTIVQGFLDTTFEGGRHQRRVDKIPC